jgi:hypothetical protein
MMFGDGSSSNFVSKAMLRRDATSSKRWPLAPLAVRTMPMKARHAAAFALVSWYLLVPPLVNAPYKIDMEAPLPSWKVYQTFGAEDKCETALSSAQSKYNKIADAPIGTIKKGSRAFALQMQFARCVSNDDPALKGN